MAGIEQNLFSLKNKVTVITGATGLLGKHHCEAIAAFGGSLVLIDINKRELKSLVKKLSNKYRTKVMGYNLDITNESEVSIVSNQVIKKFKKIDCLVNNAANNPKVTKIKSIPKNLSRLEDFSLEQWNQDISVSLTGSFLCTKYFGSLIAKNKNGGSIVNISSDLGIVAPDQRLYRRKGIPINKQPVKPVTYSVVKSGIIGLTKYTSTYWPHKVRCNALCPGGVKNNQPKEFIKLVSDRIPLNRMADADEYQGTLIWLLSDASSYLNGAVIPVDGGRTAW